MTVNQSLLLIRECNERGFEATIAWPTEVQNEGEMAKIALDFLGTWYFVSSMDCDKPTWSDMQLKSVTAKWLEIKLNTLVLVLTQCLSLKYF